MLSYFLPRKNPFSSDSNRPGVGVAVIPSTAPSLQNRPRGAARGRPTPTRGPSGQPGDGAAWRPGGRKRPRGGAAHWTAGPYFGCSRPTPVVSAARPTRPS